MILIADIADDHFATVNSDPETDRLPQVMPKKLIQLIDIGSNHRRSLQRLSTSCFRIGAEPEQRQLSIAEKLVGLAAAFDHRLRHRTQEPIDDENGIERQSLL